jgi:hypothetical protein
MGQSFVHISSEGHVNENGPPRLRRSDHRSARSKCRSSGVSRQMLSIAPKDMKLRGGVLFASTSPHQGRSMLRSRRSSTISRRARDSAAFRELLMALLSVEHLAEKEGAAPAFAALLI